jgi:hypothetical protein
MGRFISLIRGTWWLWLGYFIAGVLLTVFVSRVFVAIFPICIATFFYFAYVRYDEDGNFIGS